MNTLLEKYRVHAFEHGVAINEGNHKKANKHHDLLMSALKELKADRQGCVEQLEILLEDKDDYVRCWAATHLLKEQEAKSIKVLTELSKGVGFCAFNAGMVLDEWGKGTLQIP